MKLTKQRLLYAGMSLRFSVFMLLMTLVFPSITLAAQCSEIFTQEAENNINPNLGADALDLTGKLSNPQAWLDSGEPLGSGEYVYNGDTLENYDLELADEAEVTIFVNGNLTFGEKVRINQNGDPSQLVIIVSGSFSTTENSNSENKKIKVNGFVYAAGSISIANNNDFNGSLAAGGAIAKGNSDITAPTEWIDKQRLEGLCEVEASLPAFDNFESYSPGASIDGNNGGTNWGGAWSGVGGQSITDTSDNPLEFIDSENRRIRSATTLEITGNNNEMATRALDGTFSGDSVFLSMLVRFTGDPTDNDFVALWVGEADFGDSPQFGLKMNQGGGSSADFFVRLDRDADYSTDLEVGETYLLVAQYSKGTEDYFSNAKLWVNPECEPGPPTATSAERNTVSAGSRVSEFSNIGFRSTNLSGSDAFEIGQVAVGTQWTDVVRCSPGPLVEYRMEQASLSASAGEILDTSGNNNHAAPLNGLQTTKANPAIAGNPGTCRYGDFDGANDQIRDADAGNYLNGLEAVTVMAWVYNSASLDGNDQGIFFTDSPAGRDNRFGLRYDTQGSFSDGNNVIKASVFTSECNPNQECLQVETEPGQMVQNQWQHVAMTWTTDGEIKVYVDGAQVGTAAERGGRGTGGLAGVERLDVGQGSKGDRWQGGIDEFRIFGIALTEAEIMAEMNRAFPCAAIGPDHIRLNHPSSGLTCTPVQDITVEVCANADDDCAEKYGDELTVDLEPASGWIPGPSVTFASVSEALDLRSTAEGEVTLGVEDVSIATTGDPGLRCYADGSTVESNCKIDFAKSGLFFGIPNHISGEEKTISIQALKDDKDDPTQCVPAFEGVKDVEFDTIYQNPTTGILAVTSGTTDLTGNSLTLDFDDTATATFPLQYNDAGNVLLKARYEGVGDEQDLVMTGQDDFVARPDRFEVTVENNQNALDLTDGSYMTVAGKNFSIEVKSLNTLGQTTPNFGQETTKESVALNVDKTTLAPLTNLPALQGSLGLFGDSCAIDEGGKACGVFSWSEVGAFAIEPALVNPPYLTSEPVTGERLDYVGRFIPAWFDFSIDRGMLNSAPVSINRTTCTAERDWVYTGEAFGWKMPAQITITPKNQGGDPVKNYAGTQFQNIDESGFEFGPFPVTDKEAEGEDDTGLEMEGSLGMDVVSTGAGGSLVYAYSMNDKFRYPKSRNARVAGYTPQPVFSLVSIEDGDGVTVEDPINDLSEDFTPSADFQIRYGRIALENSYGPEDLQLVIPLTAEVYGDNGFEPHEDETCWFYDLPDNTLVVEYGDSVLDEDQTEVVDVSAEPAELTLEDARPGVSPNDYRLRLSAPGEPESPAKKGVYVELDVGNSWLRDYWDVDNPNTLVAPYAWATFGVYRGNDRIIYWQEVLD